MLDALLRELSDRYGLGDRSRDLFGLLMGYIYNDRRGGFDGFIESFRLQGHGDLFASWLGGDPRKQRPLTASDVGMVFGQGLLSDWGNRIGASRATVAAAIAGILPRLIGELTPGGRLPGGFAATPVAGSRGEEAVEAGIGVPAVASLGVAAPTQEYASRFSREGARPDERGPFEPAAQAVPLQRREADALRRDDSRVEPVSFTAVEDPHVAAITAAVTASTPPTPSFAADDPLRDFEFRRTPPQRKRRGYGWLLWLLVVLILAAGVGYYWWLGFPPLDSLQLPWAVAPAAG